MKIRKLVKDYGELTDRLEYSFKDKKLLFQALSHPSFVYEIGKAHIADNQRLEFLGDAVISLAISHLLMDAFPEMKEGDLSKHRALLVNENCLYSIANRLKLGEYLLLGKGEEQTNGREKPSILADAFEALIGSIYLDSGFPNAFNVVSRLFRQELNNISLGKPTIDYKTELQEHLQRVFRLIPEYRLEKEIGPDHLKTFYAAVYIKGKIMGRGTGKSKKEAEQSAAKEALSCLKK